MADTLKLHPDAPLPFAEGVSIEKRPLLSDLPWSVQFQFQAETDPTGKEKEWWNGQAVRLTRAIADKYLTLLCSRAGVNSH